ncbi:MAG: hypothetical protein HOQ26_12465 [Gemmatimonadaceae bacterium]|nr:hypothetical protein [Gemmatimonadaceae bacterium]
MTPRSAASTAVRRRAALIVFAAVSVLPLVVHGQSSPAQAQAPACKPGQVCTNVIVSDSTPPTVIISPSSLNTTASSASVTIDWCDDHALNTSTRHITLNGSAVSLTWTTSAKAGCGVHATSTGTVNLAMGLNVLHADIRDNNGNQGSDDADYTRITLGVAVGLDTAATTLPVNQSAAQLFTAKNTGSSTITFTVSGRCSGAALTTTCVANPTAFTLAPGATGTFTVSYRTGAVGGTNGRVAGVATYSTASDSGWVSVSVPANYAVTVSPRGAPKVVATSSSQSQAFTVTNTGNTSASYNLTPSCSGSLIATGSCSVTPTSATIAAGSSTTVTLGFTTATTGTATATVIATQNGVPALAVDSGWVAVTTATPLASVSLARANPGTTVEKGACLHFSVRPGVGTECGVLRIAQALPAVRTLNKARVPTLVYYYDQVAAWQLVGVNVARLSTAATPDSVRAILYQRNADGSVAELSRRSYGGTSWSTTAPQRLTLTLGGLAGGTSRIISYRVQVDFKAAGQAWAAAAPPADGELAVVRREMAAGWHVAGVEMVYVQSPTSVLWVGGDGSTRKYTLQATVGTNQVFTTRALDRADTMLRSTTNLTYTRRAGNGLQIVFDTTGRHVQTINRLGKTTTFTYVGTTRRLATITVPPASAGLVYMFNYDANGTLSSVSAPGAPAARLTTFAPGSTIGTITRITNPDSSHLDFEYFTDAGRTALVNAFTDRRGTRTTLDQEPYSPTLAASHTTGGTQTITQTFRHASAIGASPTDGPVAIDSVYTRYDGPRDNVADAMDVTKIWLGDFDVPMKVADPIGATTTVVYGDSRFPLLATRVTRPGGLVTAAGYDARGNVVADTVYNPLGDGRNAVTTYAWDSTWDLVTQITSPTGIVTERAYDAITGNPRWTQTGGASHSTAFTYYGTADGILSGLLHWTTLPTGEMSEVRYDATRGNARMARSPIGYIALSYSDAIGRDTLSITPIDTALKNASGTFVNVRDSTGVVQTGTRVRTHYDLADRPSDQWSENGPASTTYQIAAETLHVHTDYDVGGLPLLVKRRALPDTNHVGWIIDTWAYDAFGRDTLSAPLGRKHYDLAGNLVWTSHGDSSVYDARGLRTKHLLPAVHWLRRDNTWFMAEPDSAAADSEVYAYGLEGELLKADNRYATIHRGYFANGALRADTSVIAGYSGGSGIGPANTPIAYEYDLEGRQTRLRHALISGSGANGPLDAVQYSYDPLTGALKQLIDPQGNAYTYTEDAAGRLTSLAFPGTTESYRYDADSRLRWINGDSLKRDARGKVVWKSNGTTNGTVSAIYSALGNLTEYLRGPGDESYHQPDALGNTPAVDISGTNGGAFGPFTDGSWTKVYNQHGAIDSQKRYREEEPYSGEWRPDGEWSYDGGGNVYDAMSFAYAMRQVAPNCIPAVGGTNCEAPAVDTTHAYSSYDANSRLRYTISTTRQHYWNGDSVHIKTWEYRYDALGRRIMSRYRGPWEYRNNNGSSNRATLDYQTWDGSELLAETRAVESALPPGTPNFDGLVVYTNGAQLDVPLSIYRSSSSSPCAFVISPHADWRGTMVSGSFNGAMPSCANVVFPANSMTAYRQGPGSDQTNPWNGSLIDQGADQSGLQYMRNRYYNPAAGQFTQADPIGIAGGMNSYGYAGGDPVSYSDPLGLCFAPPVAVQCIAVAGTIAVAASVALVNWIQNHPVDPILYGTPSLPFFSKTHRREKPDDDDGELPTPPPANAPPKEGQGDKEPGQQQEEVEQAQQRSRQQGKPNRIERINKSAQRGRVDRLEQAREEAQKAIDEMNKQKKP